MNPRSLKIVLALIALVGAFVALTTASMLRTARNELRLVTQLAGNLRIRDPNQISFVRFKGVVPGEYAWRFYIPPGFKAAPWDSENDKVQHFIARARFAYSAEGKFLVQTCFRDRWRTRELGSPALAQFVREHSFDLIIEQAGRRQQQNLAAGGQHTLLRLTIPEHLIPEARQQLSEMEASKVVPIIFEWQLGEGV